MDLREINEKIWFQGRTTHDTKLDPSYVGHGTDQEGPGWYFTDHAEDASRYAAPSGSVLMGRLNIRKIASSEKPASRKTIQELVERAPDLEHTLTNWDENPKRALKAAIDSILKYNPLEKDAFQQVWIDFYKTEPVEYLDALVALGYDGHVPTGSWGALHHFVLYNAKAFRMEDSYPYAEGSTTADAVQTPISERYDYGPSWNGTAEAASKKVFTVDQVRDSLRRGGRDLSEEDGTLDAEAQDLAHFLNSFGPTIEVFRAVHARKQKDIDLSKLGEHWTHSERSALNFAKNNLQRPWFIISAKIKHAAIDWAQTLSQNVHHPYEEELNIRSFDWKNLKDVKIKSIGKRAVAAAYEKTVQTPGGKPVEVFKNPSRKELKEIAQHDEVRAFLVGNDLIVWNTYGAIHHQMSEQIQIPDDSVALNMNVHQDGKSYYVRVSDWTRRSSWFHNPEIVPYIMNHPALKLVRDRGPEFEIGFFDEAIVGRWDELQEDERDTAGVEDTDYPYYHVTDHPNKPTVRKDYTKFTGNKRHDWEPYGIFLFPKGEEVVTIGYGERKWRWDAKLKPGAKILNINEPSTMSKLLREAEVTPYSVISRVGGSMGYYGSRLNDLMETIYSEQEDAGQPGDWSTIISRLRGAQESEKFADAFKEQLAPIYAGWKKWLMPEGYVDTDRGWAALVAHFSKDKAESITKFLKSQGDVVSDVDGNAFYDGEPQILVVNPNVIRWLKREKNSADTEKEFEVYPLMVGSVTASPDSLRREFRDLYESEEFYDDEFMDYYDGDAEKARQWYQMAYEGFRNRMEHWHWGTNGVRCWRVITVPKGEKVNLKQLGGSWSYRKEAAHSWYGTGGKKFTFEAEIPEAAIDRDVTLRNNLVNLDEEEIRTYDHQTIYLYAVLNSKGERVREFNPPIETQTGAIDMFGGSMVGEKAEAGGFYFWDDQDGPLYPTPPNQDKGSDQRTMPQQAMDWPNLKLEAAKPKRYPTEDDYEDAWAVMKHAYSMEPTDEYEQQDLEDMGEKWHASLRKARMKTWKVKDAAKKFQIMDHGRRLDGEELENPIIVAVIGKQYIVLDGSHRLITKFERSAETIDALMVPMNWADELTAMDGDTLAVVAERTEAKQVFKSTKTKPFVTVWRMQNDKGYGPYQNTKYDDVNGYDIPEWADMPHDPTTNHPDWRDDKGFSPSDRKTFLNDKVGYLFGFRTLKGLQKWFDPEEIERLGELGFHPIELKASRVWDSGKQIFFEPFKEAVAAAIEFLSAPSIWNGRSEIEAGVRIGPKTYVAKKDLKTFVDTYVQVADEGLKDEIDAAATDDDFPEAFYEQNQDMIYFNDLTFRTYRPNDMLFETIMMALLTRRPLPQKVRVILYAPARDKTYLVKDLLQKGEHLLQSATEETDEETEPAAR